MSLTATAHSVPGTLRQEVVVDGRHRLFTDEPERLGGDCAGPAPHELIPAAVASCVATSLVMYARTKGWELGDVSVDVGYQNDAMPRTCAVMVTIEAALTEDQLTRLAKVARACPVRRALEAGVEFTETIRGASPLDDWAAA
jgi:putative redox protein